LYLCWSDFFPKNSDYKFFRKKVWLKHQERKKCFNFFEKNIQKKNKLILFIFFEKNDIQNR